MPLTKHRRLIDQAALSVVSAHAHFVEASEAVRQANLALHEHLQGLITRSEIPHDSSQEQQMKKDILQSYHDFHQTLAAIEQHVREIYELTGNSLQILEQHGVIEKLTTQTYKGE